MHRGDKDARCYIFLREELLEVTITSFGGTARYRTLPPLPSTNPRNPSHPEPLEKTKVRDPNHSSREVVSGIHPPHCGNVPLGHCHDVRTKSGVRLRRPPLHSSPTISVHILASLASAEHGQSPPLLVIVAQPALAVYAAH